MSSSSAATNEDLKSMADDLRRLLSSTKEDKPVADLLEGISKSIARMEESEINRDIVDPEPYDRFHDTRILQELEKDDDYYVFAREVHQYSGVPVEQLVKKDTLGNALSLGSGSSRLMSYVTERKKGASYEDSVARSLARRHPARPLDKRDADEIVLQIRWLSKMEIGITQAMSRLRAVTTLLSDANVEKVARASGASPGSRAERVKLVEEAMIKCETARPMLSRLVGTIIRELDAPKAAGPLSSDELALGFRRLRWRATMDGLEFTHPTAEEIVQQAIMRRGALSGASGGGGHHSDYLPQWPAHRTGAPRARGGTFPSLVVHSWNSSSYM